MHLSVLPPHGPPPPPPQRPPPPPSPPVSGEPLLASLACGGGGDGNDGEFVGYGNGCWSLYSMRLVAYENELIL